MCRRCGSLAHFRLTAGPSGYRGSGSSQEPKGPRLMTTTQPITPSTNTNPKAIAGTVPQPSGPSCRVQNLMSTWRSPLRSHPLPEPPWAGRKGHSRDALTTSPSGEALFCLLSSPLRGAPAVAGALGWTLCDFSQRACAVDGQRCLHPAGLSTALWGMGGTWQITVMCLGALLPWSQLWFQNLLLGPSSGF